MSEPDEVFERNLERLLTRAYTAVLPGEAYRARLEAAVLEGLDAQQAARRGAAQTAPLPSTLRSPSQPSSRDARPSSSRPILGPVLEPLLRPLLAAAALLLAVSAVWWLVSAPEPRALDGLLADGHVAWRALVGGDWAALPDDELSASIGRDARPREFATPALRRFDVDLAPDGGLTLQPASQASLTREAGGLRIDLTRGALDVRRDSDAASGGDDWLVAAGDRLVHLETGALSVARGSQAADVSVLLWSGRAWLETPGGRQDLSPGQPVADGAADRSLPHWDALRLPTEPLVAPAAGAETAAAADIVPPDEEAAEPQASAAPNSLQGRVVDRATSLPLAAYTLTLVLEDVTSQGPRDEARQVTAQDGRFTWTDIEPGTYALFAQAPGYATASRRGLALGGGEPLAALELALEPGGATLAGRVVDAASGAPLAGALVLSESDAPVHMLALDPAELPAGITARTTTREDGGFELVGLASGPQILRATADGFAPQWITVELPDAPDASDASRPSIELRLPAPASVQGRVTLDNGAPAAGMFVLVSLGERWPQRACLGMRYGITDAEGRYRLADLPAEEAVVLMLGPVAQLDAPPTAPRMLPVQLRAGEAATVDFLGELRAGRLRGRIVDAAGEPAGGLMLSLVAADATAAQARGDWLGAMTDEQGAYEFGDLARGRYELYLVQGAGVSVVRVGALEFLGGDQQHDLQLPGATLTGILRDGVSGEALPNGLLIVTAAPAAGLVVGARMGEGDEAEFEARVQLGPDGRFTCGPFPPGHYRLQAHAGTAEWGEALAEVDLPAEQGEVAVVLESFPGGSLSVLAVDERGAPLAGVLVELIHPAGRRIDFAASPLTGEDGVFRVGGLSTGWWSARVSLDGRLSSEQRLEIRAGETASMRAVLAPAR